MDPAYLAVFKSDFYPPRVERCAGEDVPDYAFRKPAGALVFFQDDRDREAGMDVFSVPAVQ